MSQAFLMVLREGFEAFLIVAIILSYLRTTGRNQLVAAVYVAIAVSLLLSLGLGFVLMRGVNAALWEGVLGVVTMLMVGSLVVHMWRTAPRMKQNIQAQLDKAALRASTKLQYVGVFLFTALMITREGMETALMLLQVRDGDVISGIILGLLSAALMAWMWSHFSHLINIKRFFQVTGVFLILFIVQVGIYTVHEFSESGIFPNSEAFHEATEPYSPTGLYGKWFSIVMVGTSILWLLVGFVIDRWKKRSVLAADVLATSE